MRLSWRLIQTFLLAILLLLAALLAISTMMRFNFQQSLAAVLSVCGFSIAQSSYGHDSSANVSLDWHAPAKWKVNELSTVINGSGIYGWTFNTSHNTPSSTTYNWCNMPHVNPGNYPRASSEYKLQYVEEGYAWYCDNEGLFFGGEPMKPASEGSADTYWSVYTSSSNPLAPQGFNGTCQFPQQTRGGLEDSYKHGQDLKTVYGEMLGFIPSQYNPGAVSYRVTNNVITSQVASMVIPGMYPSTDDKNFPLLIQPASIDSLEPAYSCDYASELFSSYGAGSESSGWLKHINASQPLFDRLDALSGVNVSDSGWHMSWDHYFDNLSARLCHNKPLPCKIGNASNCVTTAEAEEVFRLGEYEYSFIYRDQPQSLPASTASFGIWVGELAQNLRHAMGEGPSSVGKTPESVRYRHNVAHDGSVSRLLSILQVERMVWPGMGAEVIFELYSKEGKYFVRVLWTAEVLKSSNPSLGKMDMVPVETLLAYFDGLVGVGGNRIPGLCAQS